MAVGKKEKELAKKLGIKPLSEAKEKKHQEMMKKYRKIWKERQCIHWVDSSD